MVRVVGEPRLNWNNRMSKDSTEIITTNFGLNKHLGANKDRKLNATEHVRRFSDMNLYNHVLTNGKTAHYRTPGFGKPHNS